MLDGEIFDAADPAPSAGPGSRRVPLLVACSLALLLLIAVVALVRPDVPVERAAPPARSTEPTDPPGEPVHADDILDRTGIGRITVGMSASEYEALFVTPNVVNSDFYPSDVDQVRRCTKYSDYSPPVSTYVWLRDNRVVTVGVDHIEGVRLRTAFGPALGDGFDAESRDLSAWDVDTAAPVPVARSIEGDSIATLADTDSDGTLDFASVGTLAGDECRLSEQQTFVEVFGQAPAVEGGALLGLSIGMSIEQVAALPGWSVDAAAQGTCRYYFSEGGDGAYLLDGVVVGIAPRHVVDGPSVEQTIDEAVATVGAERVQLSPPQRFGPAWETVMTVDDTVVYLLQSGDPLVRLDDLDADIWPPVPAGDRVIMGVHIGETCDV